MNYNHPWKPVKDVEILMRIIDMPSIRVEGCLALFIRLKTEFKKNDCLLKTLKTTKHTNL